MYCPIKSIKMLLKIENCPAFDFLKTFSGNDRTPIMRPLDIQNSRIYFKDGFVK